MLSAQETTVLRRATRYNPVGKALRRYWIPVLPVDQLPAADAPPVRLRVLNEHLIVFRDTSGRLGVLDAFCPHEGGSLAAGRNAEDGIQCMLHGWKYDVEGQRIDGGAVHVAAFKTISYPMVERQGLVWIYMGPAAERPAPPE